MPVPAVIAGLLRVLASGGKVAKNAPRADPRLLQGVTRLVGEGTTGASPAYTPATVRTTPRPSVDTPVVPSPFRVTPFGGPEVEIEDQPVEPAVAPGSDRLPPITKTVNIESVPYPDSVPLVSPEAAPAQPAAPARVIVPQTRDEQLEAYENFGKNIPGTIDIGAQSFKIAGPSDIGQRATVPIPGAGATGSEDIASEVTRRLGLAPAAAAPAAASAQDGGGFFSNLLKGGILDSESPLSRQQRVMLGVAALKDAGNALEGKSTNFFGQTQQGFQKARESASERQFKFLQQARIAGSEAATLLGGITPLTPPSQRAQIERQAAALKQMQENFLQQAGVGQQPAPAAQDATPSVGGVSGEGADLAQSQRRAMALASGTIPETIQQAREDLRILQDAALEDPKFFPLLEKAQKTVTTFTVAQDGARAEVANTNNQIRNIVEVLLPNVESGAGLMSLLNVIPGTDAADFEANLDSLKAFEGFSNLQRMREVSPTGGALGQVTERELMFLQSAFSALKATTSGPALKANLQVLLESYKDVVRKAYQGADGGYNKEAETVFGPPPDWLGKEQLDETSPVVDENTYLESDSVLSVEDEET